MASYKDKNIESLHMLGYFDSEVPNKFVYKSSNIESSIRIYDNRYNIVSKINVDNKKLIISNVFSNIDAVGSHVLDIQERYNPEEYIQCCSDLDLESYVTIIAKNKINKNKGNSTRGYTNNMIRVKSSNVWAYSMQIEDEESNTGSLFVQFKNKNGGAGDIYQYYDFPVDLWIKFVGTSSKGHFFWKYIRNNFKYRKLTGDKKGKLPNAVQ